MAIFDRPLNGERFGRGGELFVEESAEGGAALVASGEVVGHVGVEAFDTIEIGDARDAPPEAAGERRRLLDEEAVGVGEHRPAGVAVLGVVGVVRGHERGVVGEALLKFPHPLLPFELRHGVEQGGVGQVIDCGERLDAGGEVAKRVDKIDF